MTANYEVLVRRGRLGVRSGSRLVFLIVALSGISFLVWGFNWQVRALMWLVGVSLIFLLLELYALRSNEKKMKEAMRSVAEETKKLEPIEDHQFKLVSIPDEGEWYVRKIIFDGNQVSIRISTAPGLLDKALPHALGLCNEPDQLAIRFKKSLSVEAKRNPLFSAEIQRLKIDCIVFLSSTRSGTAEVYFTPESGGDVWGCLLEDGEFQELAMES